MSKVTLHLQSVPAWMPEFVRRSGVQWLKWVDPPCTQPDWCQGVKVIGRTYEPDQDSNARIWQGAVGARSWFDKWLAFYRERPWVHAWEGPNEPQPMADAAFRAKLNEFTVELARLMHDAGLRLVGMNWAVGWPDVGHAAQMGEGVQACDYLGLHEYSAPTMQTDQGWLCLRYRNTVKELEGAGFIIPPIIVGECGIDGGVYTTSLPGKGWRTFCEGEFDGCYLPQLAWYSGEIERDNVACATIFTVCDWDWRDFAIDEPQAMALADWVAQDEPPEPEERARGIDISRYQNDAGPIDWKKVSESCDFVIIRASVGAFVDPSWEENYRGARAAGLLVGAYHYLEPFTEKQANALEAAVAGKEIPLGIWADMEADGLTASKCLTFLTWADAKTGRTLGIYTRASFFDRFGDPAWAHGRLLWVADWRDLPEPVLPMAWDDWEFWQTTSDGSVPGIVGRVDLDVFDGTRADLYERYGGNGDENMIEIVDRSGNPVVVDGKTWTWESVCADYGLSLTSCDPPEGAAAFKLVRLIYDGTGETNWRLYTLDEEGKPLPGVLVFMGILPPSGTDLPANTAPRLTEDFWGQPEGRPNRALTLSPDELNFTNMDGYIQHSLGAGSNYVAPIDGGEGGGTHWAWRSGDSGDYSDVPAGFGMFHNHEMFWPVFQLSTSEEQPSPSPSEEPPDGDDLAAVVEQLARIGDALESIDLSLGIISAKWPFS